MPVRVFATKMAARTLGMLLALSATLLGTAAAAPDKTKLGGWPSSFLQPSVQLADTKQNKGNEQPVQGQGCHPSYSPCLDVNASDYDCAGGSGNGPYYTGPVRVIGPDVFKLDTDGDGWGCE